MTTYMTYRFSSDDVKRNINAALKDAQGRGFPAPEKIIVNPKHATAAPNIETCGGCLTCEVWICLPTPKTV
jgi:hypothetical protein